MRTHKAHTRRRTAARQPSPPPAKIPRGRYDPRVLALACDLCGVEPGESCKRGSVATRASGYRPLGEALTAPHPQRVDAAQAIEDRMSA